MKKSKRGGVFVFIIIVVAVFSVTISLHTGSLGRALYPKDYEEYVAKYSKEYNVDENLIYSVIRTESGFDSNAKSVANAIGLMQMTEDTFNWLMSKTGESYDFEDLYKPDISIKYGTYFLSILQDKFGSPEVMAAAYHAGMNNVTKWLDDSNYSKDGKTLITTPISDTNHYVSKITDALEKYNRLYK